MTRRTRRLWTDDEKRLICQQTTVPLTCARSPLVYNVGPWRESHPSRDQESSCTQYSCQSESDNLAWGEEIKEIAEEMIMRLAALAIPLSMLMPGMGPVQADAIEDFNQFWPVLSPLLPNRGSVQATDMRDTIDALEGRWFPVGLAIPEPHVDTDWLERFCTETPVLLEPLGSLSFSMVPGGSNFNFPTRFDYIGRLQFVRSRDPDQVGSSLADGIESPFFLGMLMTYDPYATLLNPTPDTLILIGSGGSAELYGRCPD